MTLPRPGDYNVNLGKISYDYFLEKSFILGIEIEFKVCQKYSKHYSFNKERKEYYDWFEVAINYCRPTAMILMIKMLFKERKERKDVFEDLKLIVNKSFILLDLCDNLAKIFSNDTDKLPFVPEVMTCYTPEIFSELFKYLLYLGAIYNKESFLLFLDDQIYVKYKLGIFDSINKYEAGLIIVEVVEEALDDEFYLTELRKKIDLRKFLDIIEEKDRYK